MAVELRFCRGVGPAFDWQVKRNMGAQKVTPIKATFNRTPIRPTRMSQIYTYLFESDKTFP